jgi:uncharacterized protein (TIGR02246 family)
MPRIGILALCLGVLFAGPALAQDKAAMQKGDDRWAEAFNKGDAAAIAAMYTADAYVLPDHAEMAHGRAAIEAVIKKLMGNYQNDIKITAVDVMPLGPNAAREVGTYSITIKSQPPQQDSGKYATVLRKVGAKWLIATDIWNTNK